MKKWLQEVWTLIIGEFGGKMLRDVFRGELKEGAGVIAERIRSVIKENPRVELLFSLLTQEPEDFEKFRKHYREAIEGRIEGWSENAFVAALGQALPKKPDGTIDFERAKAVIKQLVNMKEEEFHQILELLKHDPISQHVRKYLKEGRNSAEAIIIASAEQWGALNRKADEAADALKNISTNIRARYTERRE